MADNINVKPTPIQRNKFDVATELTKLHFESVTPRSDEEIGEVFAKFYAIASYCEYKGAKNLQSLIPNSVMQSVGRINSDY